MTIRLAGAQAYRRRTVDALAAGRNAVHTQFPRYPSFDQALERVPISFIGWLRPYLGFAGIQVFLWTGVLLCKMVEVVWWLEDW